MSKNHKNQKRREGGRGVTLQWQLIFCIRNGRWCCTAALCRGCYRLFRQFHLPAMCDMLCLYCSGHTHTSTHTSAVLFNMRHSHGIQMTKTCDPSCYRAIEQFVQICKREFPLIHSTGLSLSLCIFFSAFLCLCLLYISDIVQCDALHRGEPNPFYHHGAKYNMIELSTIASNSK